MERPCPLGPEARDADQRAEVVEADEVPMRLFRALEPAENSDFPWFFAVSHGFRLFSLASNDQKRGDLP